MRINGRRREGFALAVALGAIVVIGTLIAGAFWTSMQHYRSTRNSLSQERALNAAEYGQNWVLANWNSGTAKAMGLGDNVDYSPTVPGGLGTADVRMTRLNQNVYWVVSEGRSGAGEGALLEARARTNLILRLDTPNMFIKGAVTAAGPVQASGNTDIIGNDANPPGWSNCPAAGPAKPTVVTDNAADVTATGGCSGQSCMYTTAPATKVAVDAKAGLASTYDNFGGMSWASLTAMAQTLYPSKVFTPGATWSINQTTVFPSAVGATCTENLPTNWGEPLRGVGAVTACEDYFPIIWIKGATTTTTISGTARGQGIMLVEGNLSMQGQAEFRGIVLVKGAFTLAGTGPGGTDGAKIIGAVMLASPTASSSIAGNSIMQYSSCAINEVLGQLNPPPVPVATRAWGDMF
jgi:hypothetical protein